jgi:hypothetical protein
MLKSAAVYGEDAVPLNLSKRHMFSSFGLNMWTGDFPLDKHYELLRQLHVGAVRISITPNIDAPRLTNARSEMELEEVIKNQGSDAWRKSLAQFGNRSRELKLEVHVVFFSTPAPWRSDRPRRGNPSKVDRFADPSHIATEANWIAAVLKSADKLGLTVSLVEIANEPNGPWNTLYTPDEYADLLIRTKGALSKAGLNSIKVEGPGTSKLSAVSEYLSVLKKRAVISQLQAVSGHDWDSSDGSRSLGAKPLDEVLTSLNVDLPINITEFSDPSPRWGEAPFKTLPKQRGPDNGADSLGFALSVAAEGLRLIGDGAAEIFLWELEDETWEGQSFGLIGVDGQQRPLAGALVATIGQIPQGSIVTGATLDNVAFVAATLNSSAVLCGVNTADTEIRASFQLPSEALARRHMKIVSYPEPRSVRVNVSEATSEASVVVPPLTAFSVTWSH